MISLHPINPPPPIFPSVPTWTHTHHNLLFYSGEKPSQQVKTWCSKSSVPLGVAQDLSLVKVGASWCWEMDGFFAVNWDHSVWLWRAGAPLRREGNVMKKKRRHFWCDIKWAGYLPQVSLFLDLEVCFFFRMSPCLTVSGCDREDVGGKRTMDNDELKTTEDVWCTTWICWISLTAGPMQGDAKWRSATQ